MLREGEGTWKWLPPLRWRGPGSADTFAIVGSIAIVLMLYRCGYVTAPPRDAVTVFFLVGLDRCLGKFSWRECDVLGNTFISRFLLKLQNKRKILRLDESDLASFDKSMLIVRMNQVVNVE